MKTEENIFVYFCFREKAQKRFHFYFKIVNTNSEMGSITASLQKEISGVPALGGILKQNRNTTIEYTQ